MTEQEALEEKKQEALAELKDRVRCADWVEIEALEREVSTNPDQV